MCLCDDNQYACIRGEDGENSADGVFLKGGVVLEVFVCICVCVLELVCELVLVYVLVLVC